MALRYRISLPNIKGFSRIYEVKESTTLYTFAKQMRADMSFPQDQMVMFKAFSDDGAVSARYAAIELGSGTIDKISMEQTLKKGEHKFIFFYDTTNAKSVIVTFEEVVPTDALAHYPLLTFSKGPDPIEFENGYVAFEDLPADKKKMPSDDEDDWDDDDEDDDVVDDGDEDGEEIYGEE